MYLIRQLTLISLEYNMRIFVEFLPGRFNVLSDALSRQNFKKFWKESKRKGLIMDERPEQLSSKLWPISKIWQW